MFDFESALIAEFRKAFSEGEISACSHMVKAFRKYQFFQEQAYYHQAESLAKKGYKISECGTKYSVFVWKDYYTFDYQSEFYEVCRTDKELIEIVEKYIEDDDFETFEENFQSFLVNDGWDECCLPLLVYDQEYSILTLDIWDDFEIDVDAELREEDIRVIDF